MSTPNSECSVEAHYREAMQQVQVALAETQVLYRVARSLIGVETLPDLLQTVVDSVAEALPANRVTLITFDLAAHQVTHFVKGGLGITDVVEVAFHELWDGLSGWTLREQKPALSSKASPDVRESLAVQRRRAETNCGAIIVVPLQYQDRLLGTLTAINRPEERDFTERDVDLMVAMASQSAIAIETARLYKELQATNVVLEQRVGERTAELAEINTRLQEEIAQHKHAEATLGEINRAYRTLSRCNQALLRATSEADLLHDMCRIIRDEWGYPLVWIGFAEQDMAKTVRPVAHIGYEAGYLETLKLTWADTERGRGPAGTAIRTRQPVVNRDVLTNAAFAPWRDEAIRRGYASSAAFPVLTQDAPGVLAVYAAQADAFEPDTVALFTELANDLAYGMTTLRERAGREHATQALQASEARYRLLVETMNDGLVVIDGRMTITYANPRFCDLLGYASNELLGQSMRLFLDSANREIFDAQIAKRRMGERGVYELDWTKKDSRRISTRVSGSPLLDDQRKFLGSFAVVTDITERKRAEAERRSHLRFLEGMDQVNRVIQGANDLDQMMSEILDTLLALFGCDRAWLVYPCDPDAATWQVPMERTRPEYPGMLPIGVERPLDPTGAAVYRILRNSAGPVQFGPGSAHPVPIEMAQGFQVQSFMAMAFYPKVDKPWTFGLHQCTYARVWTPDEESLFQEIGRRLADALTSLLVVRSLRESNERFETLFRYSPYAIFLMDFATLKIVDCNEAACQMNGYAREELIGQHIDMLNVSATPDEVSAQHKERLRREGRLRFQQEHARKDGRKITIDNTVCYFSIADRELIVGIDQDITDRKRAEEELKAQYSTLRSIIDSTKAPIFSVDRQYRYTSFNQGHAAVMKALYDAEIEIGHSLLGYMTVAEDRESARRNLDRALTGEHLLREAYSGEESQSRQYFQVSHSPVKTETGQIIGVAMLAQDMTERKRAEEALQRSNQRLSILHEIDRRILVAKSPDSIARDVLDQLVQLIPCEFVSINLYNDAITEEWIFALQHTPDITVHTETVMPCVENTSHARTKSGHTSVTADLNFHERPLPPLAEDLIAQGMHAAMSNPVIAQGKLIGVLNFASMRVGFFTPEHQQIAEEIAAQVAIALHQATLNDQIARHNAELEQRVRERTTQLENANRELETFSYSVSHDLRAPLRAIQGFAEIIARRHRDNLNDEGRRYFDNIVMASEQMDQLITNLLGYARLGRQHVQWLPAIALKVILREVMDNLAPQIEETGAQIHIADDLPEVQGDKTLLRQIFTNLLQNALIYHQPGVPPQVNVDAVSEPDYTVIRVADKGIGISAEFHEKIFNVFYRLHSQDQYPGTGIGLAVVRKSVELLNGTIWVESELMKGSTFYVRFPRLNGEERHS